MRYFAVSVAVVLVCGFQAVNVRASETAGELVGTHVVTTPGEVQFVDRDRQPLGVARGGTVLDVLDARGKMLQVSRGWINRADVVPHDAAIEFFSEQLRGAPTAVAYASRARVWNYLGEFDKAVADCDEALTLDPACSMAYDRRAQALTAAGELDRALGDFDQAIRLTPAYGSAYSHRARAWLEKGELDKALADCDAALKRDATLYLAHYYRGRVWSRKGAADKAIASFGRALDQNPHYVPALNARGNERFKKSQFAKAEDDYSAAIRLDPKFDRVHLHYNRGSARLHLGDPKQARADFLEALRDDERYVPAIQGLAACFAMQGDYKAAIHWQAKAVKLAKAEQKPKLNAVLARYQAARSR
jgi:tetratricopeptide (TPR) repeat protein